MKNIVLSIIALLVVSQAVFSADAEYRSKNYPDGGIMYDGHFIGDKPVDVTRYYRSGRVQSTQQFDGSGNCTVKMFNEDATPFAEGMYNSAKQRDGVWRFYGKNGGVANIVSFREGLRDGQTIMFSASGVVLDSMNYVSDKLDGERVKYYPNGKKMVVFNYKAGVVDGKYVSFFDDGSTDTEGAYKEGLKDGVWKFYQEDGSITEYKFKKGKCKKYEDAIKKENVESDIDRHIAEPSIENL